MEETWWPTSYALWQRSKRSLVGGVSTGMRAAAKPHPLFFERASGAYLWDVDGHRLLDYVLGWGAVLLGHAHPGVVQAVTRQVAAGETFGAQHRLEYEVAERILDRFSFADRVLYSNTGTEAVQVALRLARAATGRTKVIKFVGHYHGWADSVLISYRPPDPAGRTPYLESRGQVASVQEEVLVCPWNDRAALQSLIQRFPQDIAAIIAEPVLCNSGVIAPEPGYLEWIRSWATRAGSVLIFDEVITGFRLGPSGATGHYGVSPDLIVLGKAVANGYPLSLVAGKAALMDQADGGGVVHAGTFNGNPVVLQAAMATLTALDGAETWSRLVQATALLASGLRERLHHYHWAGRVNHLGGVLQVLLGVHEPVTDYAGYAAADHATYTQLLIECLKRNVYLLPGGRLYVSAAHTDEDIRMTLAAFDAAMEAVSLAKEGVHRGDTDSSRMETGRH